MLWLVVVLVLPLLFFFTDKIKDILAYNVDSAKWSNPENIRVYIPKDYWAKAMKKAFEEWSAALNHKLKFSYAVSADFCDIEVVFIKKFHEWDAGDGKVGETFFEEFENDLFENIKICITEKDVEDNSIVDFVYNIMLHEIGHAIGLMRHSDNKNSIMYPEVTEGQKITSEEIKRLKKLYGFTDETI